MSFKETEVGKIPKEWNVDFIDNIKSNKKNAIAMGPFGSNIKKENFVDYGIPVIRGNNLSSMRLCEDEFIYLTEEKADKLKSSEVNRGDIVITHRGTLGQVSYVPYNSKYKKYIVSQSGMKLTCDTEKADPIFINYFLNSRIGQYLLLRNKSQVGVPSIATPTTSLKKIHVPLPTLGEQKAIANILSTLDDKIEVNNKINQKLEEMAQTIFKQWFIDFDFPNEEGKPYKSSGGEVVESELGMIPKGWEVKSIGELPITVTDYVANGSFKSLKENVTLYEEENYALFMRNTDLKCKFSSDKKFVDEHSYNFLGKSKLFGGEIIISNVGDVGSVYMCPLFDRPMTLGNNVIMINTKKNNIDLNKYLFRLFKSYLGQHLISSITGGSAQPKFNKTDFRNIKIAMPKDDIINIYNKALEKVENKMLKIDIENRKISTLRDTILPKLMSGEIRVPTSN